MYEIFFEISKQGVMKMETIFRECDKAFREIGRREDSEETKLRHTTLVELQQYIESFSWYDGSSKIRDEIEKYYKLPVKYWVYQTGRSPKNCNLILKRASDRIRDRIGYDKIEKILNGSLREVVYVSNALKVASFERYANELFMEDALKRICAYPCNNEYKVSELQAELKFLSFYTKWSWNFNVEKIDKDKMTYIIQVLNSVEAGDLDDKIRIIQYFNKHRDMHLIDE